VGYEALLYQIKVLLPMTQNTQTTGIFHKDFQPKPFWWEAYTPKELEPLDLPRETGCVIIGAGYAGLNAALEFAKSGHDCLVLDAAEPGFGGSTRNGGQVSGGVNVGKRIMNRALTETEAAPLLQDAAEAFTHIEDVITRHKIDCGWTKSGYFLGAWCKSHYDAMAKKINQLNKEADSESYLVPKAEQRTEIGSDYYHGGMVVQRAAHLHPALYFKGLLDLAKAAGVAIASNTPVDKLTEENGGWRASTPHGDIWCKDVLVATNGYTGKVTPQLQRRVVPVGSYIIATEELSPELAHSILPKNRSTADTRRVLTYYRLSPDMKRLIFGGRAKFGFTDPVTTAPLLHRFMLDRFPQMAGTKITHAWTGNVAFTMDEQPHMGKMDNLHFALGCNGSGIAMMSYLGRESARKINRRSNRINAFDNENFPTHWAYHGNPWFLPVVGAAFRTLDWWDRRKD
jgi:glycine/D-amino acid oxidase-like deaminating enzyme